MDHEIDWERLARYVAGESPPAEIAEVERWAASAPEHGAVVTELRAIWANADLAPSGWSADAAWREMERGLDGVAAPRLVERGRLGPASRIRPLVGPSALARGLRAAAAIVLLAGVGFGALRLAGRKPEQVADAALPMREYVTPRGQRAQFNLADGTQVVLSVASRLRVPADYGARERRVYLEGEGYFEVTHDERRPFAVHVGAAVARDLGTRFGVRAYPDDGIRVLVVVAEGKVALRGDTAAAAEVLLAPGQLGQVEAGGTIATRSGVDVSRYLAWTEGRLVLSNAPLREALPQLARWYNLELKLGDRSLAELPVTATFRNQPTEDVLRLLARSLGLRQERRGDTVTFYSAAVGR